MEADHQHFSNLVEQHRKKPGGLLPLLHAVQDIFLNETARFAQVFLPGATFLEKNGAFINAERRISPVRKLMVPLSGKGFFAMTEYVPIDERASRSFTLLWTTGRIPTRYNVGAQTCRQDKLMKEALPS